jgi:cyanate lyase
MSPIMVTGAILGQ